MTSRPAIPQFPGEPRKNDALFVYGALQPLPWVLAYAQERAEVVHGPSCVPEREVCLERCSEDGVPVLARRGGGGTVVLMPGVVVIVVVGARASNEGPKDIFARVHRALIASLGIDTPRIEQCGLSDLAIDGCKILGSSLYLPQRPYLYCYQSSLLVNADVSLIGRYLTHPPKEPDYRAGRPHDAFCTTLATEGIELSVEEVCRRIGTRLGALLSA